MKQYILRILPAELLSYPAYRRAFGLAFVYVFLVITQFFTFEKFPSIVTGYGMPGGWLTVTVLSGLIPLLEVAALPFLLSMRVSRRTFKISKIAMLGSPMLWLIIGVWLALTTDVTTESGLMGGTIPLGNGLWLIVFSLLMTWAAWLVGRELPPRRPK